MTESTAPEQPASVLVVGLGLMGGSLAWAFKKFVPGLEVAGVDIDPEVTRAALEKGVIDVTESLDLQRPERYRFVFLAVPVGAIAPIAARIIPRLSPGAVVTDLGSVKGRVHDEVRALIPAGAHAVRFIGGHPMTGSEVQGLLGADPHLFENAVYVLTGRNDVDAPDEAFDGLRSLLEKTGAMIVEMPVELHDRVVAYVSHLPYLTAVSLVNTLRRAFTTASEPLGLAAGGFRDGTRVAACSPSLFREILESNGPRVIESLDMLLEELSEARRELVEGLSPELQARLERARELRSTLPQRHRPYPLAAFEIGVQAEDRPGFLGELAVLLGQHRINIKDFVLMHVRELESGTIRLTFERESELERALGVLRDGGYQASRR